MGDEFNFDDLDAHLEPIDKPANKAKMLEKLNIAWDNGTPFIDYTENYVFLLYPADAAGSDWQEYSYICEDGQLTRNERDPEMAFMIVKEEVMRGLPEVVPDLNVKNVNEIADKCGNDPKTFITTLIAELDPKVPIIRSKDEMSKAVGIVEKS